MSWFFNNEKTIKVFLLKTVWVECQLEVPSGWKSKTEERCRNTDQVTCLLIEGPENNKRIVSSPTDRWSGHPKEYIPFSFNAQMPLIKWNVTNLITIFKEKKTHYEIKYAYPKLNEILQWNITTKPILNFKKCDNFPKVNWFYPPLKAKVKSLELNTSILEV